MKTLIPFLPLIVAFFIVLFPPYARILRRTGFSRWWAVLIIVPGVNVVLLWLFAYARWPALEAVADSSSEKRQ